VGLTREQAIRPAGARRQRGEEKRENKRIYLGAAEDTRKSKPEGTEEAEIAPCNMGCGF
jgi:hypothetical protein